MALEKLSFGGGTTTFTGSGKEVPPPGAGLKTVTCAVPAVAMLVAAIEAVNSKALASVVGRSLPFQRTTEAATKPNQKTCRVYAGPPAGAFMGSRKKASGTGLSMATVSGLDSPPPGMGLNTVTCAVPALAISLARMETVKVVALLTVVVRSAPFQRKTERETN